MIRLAEISPTPIVLLTPGSPRIGDFPAENIIQIYEDQPQKVEVLDAKSEPNIVAVLTEKAMNTRSLSRQHIAGVQVLQ